MSDKDLKRDPQHKSGEPGWWWYEENRGLCIVTETEGVVGIIPWRRVREAVARKDKKARP